MNIADRIIAGHTALERMGLERTIIMHAVIDLISPDFLSCDVHIEGPNNTFWHIFKNPEQNGLIVECTRKVGGNEEILYSTNGPLESGVTELEKRILCHEALNAFLTEMMEKFPVLIEKLRPFIVAAKKYS